MLCNKLNNIAAIYACQSHFHCTELNATATDNAYGSRDRILGVTVSKHAFTFNEDNATFSVCYKNDVDIFERRSVTVLI